MVKFAETIQRKVPTEEGQYVGAFVNANSLMNNENVQINGVVEIRRNKEGMIEESAERSLEFVNRLLEKSMTPLQHELSVQRKIINSQVKLFNEQAAKIEILQDDNRVIKEENKAIKEEMRALKVQLKKTFLEITECI